MSKIERVLRFELKKKFNNFNSHAILRRVAKTLEDPSFLKM